MYTKWYPPVPKLITVQMSNVSPSRVRRMATAPESVQFLPCGAQSQHELVTKLVPEKLKPQVWINGMMKYCAQCVLVTFFFVGPASPDLSFET